MDCEQDLIQKPHLLLATYPVSIAVEMSAVTRTPRRTGAAPAARAAEQFANARPDDGADIRPCGLAGTDLAPLAL